MRSERPVCPRCRGKLIAERGLDGRVVSIGCLICGHRIYRDYKLRSADGGGTRSFSRAGRVAV